DSEQYSRLAIVYHRLDFASGEFSHSRSYRDCGERTYRESKDRLPRTKEQAVLFCDFLRFFEPSREDDDALTIEGFSSRYHNRRNNRFVLFMRTADAVGNFPEFCVVY